MSFEPTLSIDANETLAGALRIAREMLARAGIESVAIDARCLLESATGLGRADVLAGGDRTLGENAAKLAALISRRIAGEPVARILGEREFWGLSFTLTPATLVPRPETETLVEDVLSHCDASHGRAHPWSILDLGTGTGCIAIALLSELPAAYGVGVDQSPEAAATAAANARRSGVADRARFVVSDWANAIARRFDIVVSNPPYIAAAELAGLAAEVRDHDPRLALDAGSDGLDAYRALLADAPRLMAGGARIVLEIGAGQAPAVRQLMEAAGFSRVTTRRDLAGIERSLSAALPPLDGNAWP